LKAFAATNLLLFVEFELYNGNKSIYNQTNKMKKISHLIILSLILLPLNLIGQKKFTQTPHPQFESFVGDVYEMPRIRIEKGGIISNRIQNHYGKNIYDYPKIGRIGLKNSIFQKEVSMNIVSLE